MMNLPGNKSTDMDASTKMELGRTTDMDSRETLDILPINNKSIDS